MDQEGARAAMRQEIEQRRGANGVSTAPTITVCVCTHDRPHYVRSCLEGLRVQSVGLDAFDIIVVDSCSPDGVNEQLRSLVETLPNARLLRAERLGASIARNIAATATTADYLAYIDDDAIAAPDWIEQAQRVIQEQDPWPAVLGGRSLPLWESPLPAWWPDSLRGVLSIIEWEGRGEYRTPQVPAMLEPYGVNMIVHRRRMLDVGGFDETLGRFGGFLLSDEDVQLAWKLQDLGHSVRYDSRLTVHHQIQASRLVPDWLLNRLYYQGASTVITRRLLNQQELIWREFFRRLAVETLCAPCALISKHSTRWLELRWRLAYARGFTRMALGGTPRKRTAVLRMLKGIRSYSKGSSRVVQPGTQPSGMVKVTRPDPST
jgi:glycosyltransferase involved in cell wall biosynthesis